MKKNTPLMLGLLSLGIVSGATTTVLTTNVFAAEDATTSAAVATADTEVPPELTEEQKTMKTLHDAAEAALKAGDYTAWSAAMTEINETQYQKMKEAITQDNFAILQQIQTAREAKDFETVRTLSKQIGMPMMGMGGMHRGGPGFHHGPRPEGVRDAQDDTQNQ